MNQQSKNSNLGKLSATFRHNPPHYKEIYLQSKIILAISVGQEYHEGEKLGAVIDLVNNTLFKECSIMVGDSIQRHTMCIDQYTNLDEAHI